MTQPKLKNVDDIYALTGMQQLMLVHALHDPKSETLQEQFSLSLDGRIEFELLTEAWQRVAERHPALRTCFLWQGLEKPLQVVRKQVELAWTALDWRDLAAAEQTRRTAALIDDDGGQPLELTREPLMRMTLIRLADEKYLFIWRAHHLLFDGWSLAIVLSEVLSVYRALVHRQPLHLPPAPAFRDYLGWLGRRDAEAEEAFWRRKLAGFRLPTPLASTGEPLASTGEPEALASGFSGAAITLDDSEADASGSPTFGGERLRLSAETTAALNAWSRQRQLTPAVLVQGAWMLLLARASRQAEVVIGTTVSGRPADLPGVEAMVGPFINNLPLRAAIDPEQPLAEWLAELQAESAEFAPHQHAPLTQLEAWSDIAPGRRLFESLVVFENYPIAENCRRQNAGFTVRDVQATVRTVYPLTLIALPNKEGRAPSPGAEGRAPSPGKEGRAPSPGESFDNEGRAPSPGEEGRAPSPGEELQLELRYQRARFAPAAMRRLLSELQTLLAAMPDAGEQTLGEFAQLEAAAPQTTPEASAGALRPRPIGAREFVAPRDELEGRLANIWAKLLGLEAVGAHDNFFELGGDSMLAVRLMAEVETDCGRKLPLAWLFQDATIERLAAVLRAPEEAPVNATLVPIRPQCDGMKQPLFCVHPAGGTVFCYRELARHFDPLRPVYGLQARGIDGLLSPHTRIADMAGEYVAAMRSVQPQGPYLLAGWSLGGILAFEMARQLADDGFETALLAVIDAGMISPEESFDEDDFLPILLEMFPDELRPSQSDLRGMSAAEQLQFFRQRAERARVLVGGDNPIQDQHVFQVFQANLNALLEYHPQPYPGKLTLFRADHGVTTLHQAPQLGWKPWVDEVEEHVIAGEHVRLFDEPQIRTIAAGLEASLQRAASHRGALPHARSTAST
ncbi:MAG TPA: condensation domain-containing protein [Pirellulales bacterium]|nr:condensation domain-containing protein [Pirellulales bacterium]